MEESGFHIIVKIVGQMAEYRYELVAVVVKKVDGGERVLWCDEMWLELQAPMTHTT